MDPVRAASAMVAIAATPGELGLLDELTASAEQLVGAESVLALLVDAAGTPTALSHQGMSADQVQQMSRSAGAVGLVSEILRGEVVRLDDLSGHPAFVELRADQVPVGPLLAVPIAVQGRVLGGLQLTRAVGAVPFTDAEQHLVCSMAQLSALVIAARRRLTGKRQILDGLAGMGLGFDESPVGHPTDPDTIIDRLLTMVRSALEVDVAFLSRVQADQQTFTHVDSSGGIDVGVGACIAPEDGYCAAMLAGDLPSSVPDTAVHAVTAAMPITAQLGVRSYNGVPVVLADGSTYGTLCVLDRETTTAGTGMQRTEALQVVARLVGHQIDRALADTASRRHDRALLEPLIDGSRRTIALQPIVDLATGAPVGFEALSRFTDVHGSPLRPDLVFAEAARLRRGVHLEQAALVSALAALPTIPEGCYLSVNLSPAALADPTTQRLLTAHDPSRVVIELTEHDRVLNYAALTRIVQRLRATGIRLAVDDAGSGYASLQHITHLQPDIIKLDIAFVRDIHLHRGHRATARALLAFATETEATFIAEGVETDTERDQLQAIGVQYAQGYLLGRPQPPNTAPRQPNPSPRTATLHMA